jgi:hypothetical protein
MSAPVNCVVPVDVRACISAFRISQWVERLLLDRGAELAANSGCSSVTAEHVESCLPALFDELSRQMREYPHERAAEKRGVAPQQSRKAA